MFHADPTTAPDGSRYYRLGSSFPLRGTIFREGSTGASAQIGLLPEPMLSCQRSDNFEINNIGAVSHDGVCQTQESTEEDVTEESDAEEDCLEVICGSSLEVCC